MVNIKHSLPKKMISLALALILAFGVCSAGIPGIIAFAEYLNPVIVQLTGGDQQRHTVQNYQSANNTYKSGLMNGYAVPMDGSNGETDICVPGLSSTDNMVPQGLTYWPAKNWILISSYHNGGTKASRIYAVSIATGRLVAQFNLYSGGSASTDHVSGIACSANNLYVAASGSYMAYIPLSELNVAEGTVKNVSYAGTVSMSGVLNGANTSYASYGDGVLWTGNFYIEGDSTYGTKAHSNYGSMLLGFSVDGYSTSAAEWQALTAIAGNPSYVIPLDPYGVNKVQCATVKNGFCYVGTSYGRTNDSNMYIFNVDLMSSQGTVSVNNHTKPLIPLKNQRNYTHLPMTEGLLVYDGYLWNIFESATYLYNGAGNLSKNPTDVLWRFDISSLLGIEREIDDESSGGDTQFKASNVTCGDLTFVVPEVIYLAPNANSSTQATTANFQYYVNNTSAGATQSAAGSTGKIYYTYSGASTATISYKFYTENLSTTLSGGSVSLSSTSISSGNSSGVTINSGSSPTLNSYEKGCYIEWKLSYTDSNDGKAKAAYAYTYVYKPLTGYSSTVAQQVGSNSSGGQKSRLTVTGWITGIHDIEQNTDSTNRVASSGADETGGMIDPPLTDDTVTNGNSTYGMDSNSSSKWLKWVDGYVGYSGYYVWSGASDNNVDTRYSYYNGILNVDISRYSNAKDIPQLIGGVDTGNQRNHSNQNGTTCFKRIGIASTTENDKTLNTTNLQNLNECHSDGERHSYALNTAVNTNTKYFVLGYDYKQYGDGKSWGSTYTRSSESIGYVYCKVIPCDKASLRTAVQNATKAMAKLGVYDASNGKPVSLYFDNNNDYKWVAFRNAYKAAVMALTKVGCSDVSGYADALNNALAALCTYYEFNANGASGTVSGYVQVGTNQSASVTPPALTREGYTFGGWSTDSNSLTGSPVTTVGYNNVFYAVWLPRYSVAFDGNGATDGSMSNQSFVYGTAQNLTSNGYTRQYTVTYKNNNGTADTSDTAAYSFAGWKGSARLINDTAEYSYDNTSGTGYHDIKQWTINAPFAANEVYHLEFDAKGSGLVTNYFYGASGYWQIASSVTGEGASFGGGDGDTRQQLTSSYKHYSVTWTLKSSGNANVNKYVLFRALAGSNLTFKNVVFYKVTGQESFSNGQNVNNLCSTSGAVYQMVAQWNPGSVTLPVPTYANYAFAGWFRDSALTDAVSGSTFTPVEDTTLYAKWLKPANDDVYIIDSGLPIELDVLENDAAGTTLSGVSIADAAVDGTKVKFTPPSIMTDKVTFTYTASYDGKPYTANVTVIPATNVYFEEKFVTLDPAISGGDSLWSVDGTSPAAEAFADVESLNGYGYNSAYENQSTYSMGTVYKTTVKRGDQPRKATFTFTGTGFDVYSLTDSTCGVIMVNIKKLNNGEWVQVSNKVLSTYFGNEYGPLYLKDGKVTLDSDGAAIYPATANSSNTFFIQGSDKGTTEYYEGAKQINGWVATGAEGNGIYQTPVISETLGYGTYTVTIEPKYSAIFDTAGKGQFSFYLDSIRIYNPINPESVTAGTDVYEKYLADKEQGAQYESIREKIIAADTFGETGQYTAGVAFLEKMNSSTGNSAIKNYSDIGPKNEVYLEPNQAIAFNITTGGAVQPAKVAVGIRVIKGTNGKATVASSRSNQYSLSGATELYRDITAQLDFELSDGKYTTAQPVVIANTSGENTVIALTKIKYSFGAQEQNAPAGARQLMFTFDEPALLNSRGIMNTIFNPVITADSTGVTAKWDKTVIALGETATLTITADENYTKAFIDGGEAAGYSEENGVRTWTYAFTGSELGENAFDIKLQDINGYMTASIEAGNVKVTAPEVDINDAKISWSKDTVKSGEKVTLTVTAPSNIVKVSVGKTDITQSVTLDSGEKQFTYELETGTAGEYKYTVILTETYGYTSKNGETPVLTVEPVTPEAPEEQPGDSQPGEGGGDEQPEEENLTFFQKIIRFIVNLFNKVMELFKGIF